MSAYELVPLADPNPVPQDERDPLSVSMAGVTRSPDDFDFEAVEALKNVPGDAWQVAKYIGQAAWSPLDTMSGLHDLLTGVVQKAVPFGSTDKEIYAEKWWEDFKERYGGIDNFQRSLQNEPVQTLLDAVGLLGTNPSSAAKVARTMNPITQTTRNVQRSVKASANRVADKYMHSALKPGTTKEVDDIAEITQTMLREGLTVDEHGYRRIGAITDDINQQRNLLIEESDRINPPHDRNAFIPPLEELRDRISTNDVYGPQNRAAVDEVIQFFNDSFDAQEATELTTRQLQQLKVNTDSRINWNRSTPLRTTSKATEDALKTIRNTARELLEARAPGIDALNERYYQLMKVEPHLRRASTRTKSHDVGGLGTPTWAIGAGMGADAIGVPPQMAAGVGATVGGLRQYLGRPAVKSRHAIDLNRYGQAPLGETTAIGELARQGLFQGGRLLEDEQQEQAENEASPSQRFPYYELEPIKGESG